MNGGPLFKSSRFLTGGGLLLSAKEVMQPSAFPLDFVCRVSQVCIAAQPLRILLQACVL